MNALMQDYDVPFARHAELCLLGQLVIGCYTPEALSLSPGDIWDSRHRTIYETCLGLHNLGVKVDAISITHNLQERGALEAAGGHLFITDLLASGTAFAPLIPHWVKEIRQKAAERQKAKTMDRVVELYQEGRVTDAWRHITTSLNAARVELPCSTEADDDISSQLDDVFRDIEIAEAQPNCLPGIPTGFYDLDEMLDGLESDNMAIVAARPAMGKTAFALSMALHVTARYKLPVAFFTLEMSAKALLRRLVASISGVPTKKIRRGDLTPEERRKVDNARSYIQSLPLKILDCVGTDATPLTLRAKVQALKVKPRMAIVDYLGRMKPDEKGFSTNAEVDYMSWQVKESARLLEVPHVLLSQLNRGVEGRHVKKPQLSDLRDSGGIEQNADIVVFIHRDEYYNKNSKHKGEADLIVAKNRNGATGDVTVKYFADVQLFDGLASHRRHNLLEREAQ